MAAELRLERRTTLLTSELHDAIIDEIHHGMDLEDPHREKYLNQCSLVSSRWLVRARYWLFSDVIVYIGDKDKKLLKLVELLQSPETTIPLYLRYLVICGPNDGNKSYDQVNEMIIAILPRLHRVPSLDLDCNLEWEKLSNIAQESILRLGVTSLCWSSWATSHQISIDILSISHKISPRLEALKIDVAGLNEEADSQTSALPPYPMTFSHLHTLWIGAAFSARFLTNVDLISLPNLQRVTFEVDPLSNVTSLRYIEDMGNNLRHLTLFIVNRSSAGMYAPSLHRNNNLSSLVFIRPCVLNTNDIDWISRVIGTISTPSVDVFLEAEALGKEPVDLSGLEHSLVANNLDNSRKPTLYLAPAKTGKPSRLNIWENFLRDFLPELSLRGMVRWGRPYSSKAEIPPWTSDWPINDGMRCDELARLCFYGV